MFNDLLESTVIKMYTNKRWTVIFSTLTQIAMVGILILIPLLYTQALPKTMLAMLLVAPPPPPPVPAQPVKSVARKTGRVMRSNILVEPRAIPPTVVMLREAELPPDIADNIPANGVFTDIPGQGVEVGIGPQVPAAPKITAPSRIKQGGNVTAASIISQTQPVYPALARQARIQGNVVLHAIISRDGNVAQLEVISGHPLLVQAALDAVKQWRYKPTLLNGDPVEVDTTITVTFTMGG